MLSIPALFSDSSLRFLVILQVNPIRFLENVHTMLSHEYVYILPTKMCIPSRCNHFNTALLNDQNGDIERASTHIEH